jgi:hypothetical protein
MSSSALPFWAIFCFFNLAIWFGLFFGLNYKQIIINRDYVPTECTILSTNIGSNYCPDVECSTCSEAPSGIASCSTVVSQMESLNPSVCAAALNNSMSSSSSSSSCAQSQTCGGGYKCCSQCCSTCNSCSTSCSAGGSCSTSCYSYSCDCYCCSSVDNLDCYANADICYTDYLNLMYTNDQNTIVKTTYSRGFGTDLSGATYFITNQYLIGETYACFYDKTNGKNVLFTIGYTIGYWVVTGIFSFTLLIGIVGFIDSVIVQSAFPYNVDSRELILLRSVEFAFWCMVVMPLGFFLPMLVSASVSYTGKMVLQVFLGQLLTIGLMPLLRLRKYWLETYFLIIYPSYGWIAPLHNLIVSTDGSSDVFFAAIIIIPLFLWVVILLMIRYKEEILTHLFEFARPVPVSRNNKNITPPPPPSFASTELPLYNNTQEGIPSLQPEPIQDNNYPVLPPPNYQ